MIQPIELIKDVKADTYEDYFLEMKSELDFQNKANRAMTAKFVLESSNRLLEQATKKFAGDVFRFSRCL